MFLQIDAHLSLFIFYERGFVRLSGSSARQLLRQIRSRSLASPTRPPIVRRRGVFKLNMTDTWMPCVASNDPRDSRTKMGSRECQACGGLPWMLRLATCFEIWRWCVGGAGVLWCCDEVLCCGGVVLTCCV